MNNKHIPIYPKTMKEKNYSTIPQSSIPVSVNTTSSSKPRQVRSDKCHDIKFPVTVEEMVRLKIACKQVDFLCKSRKRTSAKITQTQFNTLLLRYGLRNIDMVVWDRQYSDSPKYMHTKPLETEYRTIGGIYGLANINGLSERKVVYCLVMTALEWLEREERNEKNEFIENKNETILRLIR